MNHWHPGGNAPVNNDDGIYIEQYTNGTTCINQNNNRMVATKDENVDCGKEMAKCKKLLEEAKASGPPEKLSLSQSGGAHNALNIKKITRDNRKLEKLLIIISGK